MQLENCNDFSIERIELLQEFTFDKLFNLWDMLTFYAASFAAVMAELRAAGQELPTLFLGVQGVDSEKIWGRAQESINTVADQMSKLPLSLSLNRQIQRVKEAVKDHSEENLSIVITKLLQNA